MMVIYHIIAMSWLIQYTNYSVPRLSSIDITKNTNFEAIYFISCNMAICSSAPYSQNTSNIHFLVRCDIHKYSVILVYLID